MLYLKRSLVFIFAVVLLNGVGGKNYDLIVIGMGSGGLAAVKRAAQFENISIAAIERSSIGGTCVNLGCVPKKILWTAASLFQSKQLNTRYGLFDPAEAFFLKISNAKKTDAHAAEFPELKNGLRWFDFAANKRIRESYIKRIHGSYASTFRNLNKTVDLYLDSEVINISDGSVVIRSKGQDKKLNGKKIIIATGGRPTKPPFPFGITSDEFWDVTSVPETTVIVGGGYIAAELASILKMLGSKRVVLVVRQSRLLMGFDNQIIDALQHDFEAGAGIELFLQHEVINVEGRVGRGNETGRVKIRRVSTLPHHENNGTITTIDPDLLIWAIGRVPNTDIQGIPASIIDPKTRLIRVNKQSFETVVPGLYAIGDCTNSTHHLTPVAIAAGRALANRLFSSSAKERIQDVPVPTTIFTIPPVSSVGDSEEEAIEKYGQHNIRTFVKPFVPMMIAAATRPDEYLKRRKAAFKLVCLGSDLRVIGIHIFGPSSEEIIQGLAVAMTTGHLTKDVLDSTIALHPSIAEEILGMDK